MLTLGSAIDTCTTELQLQIQLERKCKTVEMLSESYVIDILSAAVVYQEYTKWLFN